MKMHEGVEEQLHAFLTTAMDWGVWLASRPDRFTTGERASGTHWIRRPRRHQSRSGRGDEEKKDPRLCRPIEPPLLKQ
jgi:hypothetical protein